MAMKTGNSFGGVLKGSFAGWLSVAARNATTRDYIRVESVPKRIW
jgi:hypothetical protein